MASCSYRYIALFLQVFKLLRYMVVFSLYLSCVVHFQILILIKTVAIIILKDGKCTHCHYGCLSIQISCSHLRHFCSACACDIARSLHLELTVRIILIWPIKIIGFLLRPIKSFFNKTRVLINCNILHLKGASFSIFVILLCKYLYIDVVCLIFDNRNFLYLFVLILTLLSI